MPIAEFSLIERYFRFSANDEQLLCGVGDDGAVLAPDGGVDCVWVTDTLVESVHFVSEVDPADLAFKSLAVNLSDVAAMGGRGRWVSLALSLPARLNCEAWMSGFSKGFSETCRAFDLKLVGGDTTRADHLVVSVSVLGEVAKGQAVTRRGAQVGDVVYVTGYLGLAKRGLDQVMSGLKAGSEFDRVCLERLNRPWPRTQLGQALAGRASAMVDVSDGFLADLDHLSRASQVGVELDLSDWRFHPLHPAVPTPGAPEFWSEVSQGDDYELIFCLPESERAWFEEYQKNLDFPVSRVGRMIEQPGIFWAGHQLSPQGYSHF